MCLEAQDQFKPTRPGQSGGSVLLFLLLPLLLSSCDRFFAQGNDTVEAEGPAVSTGPGLDNPEAQTPERRAWALVVHGGFGDSGSGLHAERTAGLREVADVAARRLASGEAALQVVTDLMDQLEQDPRFNAGRGSTFNRRGVHEMSAALMDGRTRAFGAVGGLRNVRSPIAAAHAALQHHQGGPLLADAADSFSRTLSLPRAPQDSFTTPERFAAWRSFRQEARRLEREGNKVSAPIDPVGALALDSFGNLAAAVSFGGYTDAAPEQPFAISSVGPGIYADNRGAAAIAIGPEERLLSCQFPTAVATTTAHADQEMIEVLLEVANGCPGRGPLALLAIDRWGHTAIISPDATPSLLYRVAEADSTNDSTSDPSLPPAANG